MGHRKQNKKLKNCALEKRNYVSKQVIRLTLDNGEEIYETKDIIKEVKMFYERLYSDRQLEDCEILDLVEDIPTLAVQEKTSLEGEITLDEASVALKNMKNNKSPGSDGLTVEFFSSFFFFFEGGGGGGDSWVHSLLNH